MTFNSSRNSNLPPQKQMFYGITFYNYREMLKLYREFTDITIDTFPFV